MGQHHLADIVHQPHEIKGLGVRPRILQAVAQLHRQMAHPGGMKPEFLPLQYAVRNMARQLDAIRRQQRPAKRAQPHVQDRLLHIDHRLWRSVKSRVGHPQNSRRHSHIHLHKLRHLIEVHIVLPHQGLKFVQHTRQRGKTRRRLRVFQILKNAFLVV